MPWFRAPPLCGVLLAVLGAMIAAHPSVAQDNRQLVELPDSVRQEMLANMRDRLATINLIIGNVADYRFDDASKLAESRLGVASPGLQEVDRIMPLLPKPMQDIEITMHRAGTRLAVIVKAASTAPSAGALSGINRALSAVTATCDACHAHYRLH